jgi:hypothetical protein
MQKLGRQKAQQLQWQRALLSTSKNTPIITFQSIASSELTIARVHVFLKQLGRAHFDRQIGVAISIR